MDKNLLSRLADNLFWMGRYIERSEHIARYLKIQYFSSLDAPLSQKRDFVLASIMDMAGIAYENGDLDEEHVLVTVAFEKENPVSIVNSVNLARENAKGTRDLLSGQVWEQLNKFYHFVNDYSVDFYKTSGLFDLTQGVIDRCAVIKSAISNTLLHDEVWALVRVGLLLERAIQITRILQTKVNDLRLLEQNNQRTISIENYQLTTLLSSTEAGDMSRRFYRSPPSLHSSVEFLVLNQFFPRSLIYSLKHVQLYAERINPIPSYEENSFEFALGKLIAHISYMTIDEIERDLDGFFSMVLGRIHNIGNCLAKTYFDY